MRPRIAVIGGGYTGLAAATTLTRQGAQVVLFEQAATLGGLAGGFRLGDTWLDYNYRHLFRSDTEALEWIQSYGLPLDWFHSRMGYFSSSRLEPFGTPRDLLFFRPLSLAARVRFAAATLAIQKQSNWKGIEHLHAEEFLVSRYGREGFEVIWKPLLQAKFGNRYKEVGAVWMWGKIALRSRTRSRGKETLGYMPGSFSLLTDAITQELCRAQGNGPPPARVLLRAQAEALVPCAGGLRVRGTCAGTPFEERVDAVLSCLPLPEFAQVGRPVLTREEVADWSARPFTAARCLILRLRHRFSPFYWLNIGDRDIPFGGLVEQTNLLTPGHYGNTHVLYVSHYMPESEEHFGMDNEALLRAYAPHLQRICPQFSLDSVLELHGGKGRFAQPLIGPLYSQNRPTYATSHPALFHAGMAHIYPEDRGLNFALKTGREAATALLSSLLHVRQVSAAS